MTYEEKKLNTLKRFLLVKVTRIEEGEIYRKVYYKFRKWHPCVIAVVIYSVIVFVCKEMYACTKRVIDDLNEEDYVLQIRKEETK